MIRPHFQKKLYAFTKSKHTAVERVFNFKEGINPHNSSLFHSTMLAARTYCAPHLENLESVFGIQTYNQLLLQELSKDYSKKNKAHFLDNTLTTVMSNLNDPTNFNEQLGIFYVMAGSSAGAKILLNHAKVQNINAPFYYLNHLVATSKSQMTQLHDLITTQSYQEEKVLHAATAAFDLIYKIASYGFTETSSKH